MGDCEGLFEIINVYDLNQVLLKSSRKDDLNIRNKIGPIFV